MIFLLLGSNMGDRSANLADARKRLHEALGVADKESQQVFFSPEVRTEAIGFEAPFSSIRLWFLINWKLLRESY